MVVRTTGCIAVIYPGTVPTSQRLHLMARMASKEAHAKESGLALLPQALPDANGRVHGAGLGSLEVRGEKAAHTLKPTAAARKAAR
jgi:hypothetical protein